MARTMANKGGPGSVSDGCELRILVENSEYWLRNNGDLAMLDVTLRRLRDRWPAARLAVMTDSPSLLRSYFPDCEAVTHFADEAWGTPTVAERLAARVGPRFVGPVVMAWLRSKVFVRQKYKGAVRKAARAWRRIVGRPGPAEQGASAVGPRLPDVVLSAARHSSLVVVLGGGYVTDADAAQANRVFNLVEYSREHDVPVVMVGQGIGPLEDPLLRARAAEVLPRVNLIAVRERRGGPALLEALGVPADRVVITGDDAIELPYGLRRDTPGNDLGVCIRDTTYAPIPTSARQAISTSVRAAAGDLGLRLSPIFIAEFRSQDRRSTMPIVRGVKGARRPLGRYVAPRAIAERVSGCRVVVTSAYHLGVFALSQGIPVVALSSSKYYDDKLFGLADMFGEGMRVINVGDDGLAARLDDAIHAAHAEAPEIRHALRERAAAQIQSSLAAFERAYEFVGSAPEGPHSR
ncbi:polysaccharide pyruvyl transferase family protein [Desertimonas flava]|uniref:polysaccharide pyruvyl transferase family protein n=2 Tax=Desertimonas flava TaxID=2064846 RepID=UPI002AA52D79